jgi:hypothetical protein
VAGEHIYVVRLAAWLARSLGGSAPLFEDFDSEELGIALPSSVLQAPAVVTALQQAAAAADRVAEAGEVLETAAASDDEMQILAGFLRLATELGHFFIAIDALVDAVNAAVTPANLPDPTERAAAQAFADALASSMSRYVLGTALADQAPQIAYVLRLLGLFDWRRIAPDPANPLALDHVSTSLELERPQTLIDDPEEHFRRALGWGDPAFDPTDLFLLTRDFLPEEADAEVGIDAGHPFLRIGAFRARRDGSATPPGLLLSLTAAFSDDRTKRIELNPEWGVGIRSNLRMTGTVSGLVTPPLALELRPPVAEIEGGLRAQFDRNESARPFDIVGGTGLLTITAQNAVLGAGFDASWQVTAGTASADPLLFADIEQLTLRIGSDDADSFIGSLLAAAEIEGSFDLGLEWQGSTGMRVRASGGVEIALPIHKQLGPIELQTLYLMLRIRNDGTLSTEVSTALSGQLGPLSASVDRIGATLDLRFTDAADARFGPFELVLGFKPPNGIGLAVDAGVVSGGGYLYIDTEKGEYAGALELSFANFLTLRAIGLITTRNPDGTPGFSLLILITAEFPGGLQLSFGFKLIGVGGLLGVNRSMNLQALVEGVRSGSINSVVFPRDVVANAPKIISDLRTFFPQQEGRFLIGPMAKAGWGTPTLVSLSLGIVIEIPGNIAILGVLRVALPTEDETVVNLQVSFLGAIEFDRKRVYFFASLFDSRILFLTLEGEMALLAAFGDDADFVLSVGGFHPRFTPPPLPVPTPRRMAVMILNEENARLRAEMYFAVTTNTVQVGTRAEAFFGFDAFALEGSLAFDALIQFSPFYFIIELSCSFSLKAFGVGVFSIRARVSLEGPTPWRARGTGSISLLFFEISADFDITWGEDQRKELPPIAVMPLLTGELDKQQSWQARLPPGATLLVSLRSLEEAEAALVLHPVGTLRVSQKAVPLDVRVDKVGNQRPSDARRFSLDVQPGGLVERGDVEERFAPAQFRDMDDAQKLSQPAFEPMHGGIELSASGGDLASATMVKRVVRHELITIDTAGRRNRFRFQLLSPGLFAHFLAGSSTANSPLSKAMKDRTEPFEEKVAVGGDEFVVALQSDNTAVTSVFSSDAMARDHLEQELERDPSLAGSLHVIPAFEAVA